MPRLISLFLPLASLLFLSACSDQRATFEIEGPSHSISMIRVINLPWQKSAEYAIVASRMPECNRRHVFPEKAFNIKTEVFSPGNSAWILRQSGRMYVMETRTCEGFARLDKEPENGLGDLMGTFEMKDDTLTFSRPPNTKPKSEQKN